MEKLIVTAAPVGAESGVSYDPATGVLTKYKVPVEEARKSAVQQAQTEASRRRNVLMGGPPEDSGTALRNFLSLAARATGKVRREAKGNGRPGESAELDQLEALTDGLEQIDTARDSIIAEIQSSSDPASIDIRNHPGWPALCAGNGLTLILNAGAPLSRPWLELALVIGVAHTLSRNG